jgi:(1->4)-alpha-D-glucan 1-alpha-D-glucosylmutase
VRWPLGMVTTSTHDTKRSEDVRARLAVLSEIPDEWARILHRWCERTRQWWRPPTRRDPALDVLMHQTLVGAHPLESGRAHTYLDKAMREAKRATSWLDPDEEFERAAHAVLDAMLRDPVHVAEVEEFADRLLVPGRVNSLAQKLLALTMPGVPDVYQGSELWNLHLVDPDNRQPVDFALRRRLLEEVIARHDPTRWRATLADPLDPGLPKLAVVHHAIAVRRRHAGCFAGPASGYAELPVDGPARDHLVAFVRGSRVATVVPRLTVKLERAGGWRGTAVTLPSGGWVDAFTGVEREGRVDADQLLADLPVCLLERG